MYHPTDFDALMKHVDGERDAFVAAAVLPHLPENQALARIRTEDERVPTFEKPETIEAFRHRVPTIGGSKNLRRVRPEAPAGHDAIEEQVDLYPEPHRVRSYHVGSYDVDLLCPTDDEYDWSTPQASLSDFGAGASVLQAIDPFDTDDSYERKPLFPV